MATIVGVTAVLVTEPPAKASIKPPKLFNTFAPLGNIELNMTMEPAQDRARTSSTSTPSPRAAFPPPRRR